MQINSKLSNPIQKYKKMKARKDTSAKDRDCKLVKSALDKNDQKAYAELMRLHRNGVYYNMLKKVKNDFYADRLTIEAFGKAFDNLRTYNPENAFSTWLYTIAKNNCIDRLEEDKKNQKIKSLDDTNRYGSEDEPTKNYDPVDQYPDEKALENDRIVEIQDIMKELAFIHQETLEMLTNMSCGEMADKLGLPIYVIKDRVKNARAAFEAICPEELRFWIKRKNTRKSGKYRH